MLSIGVSSNMVRRLSREKTKIETEGMKASTNVHL